jgi:tetratricopeptide (TPR) repeat protein
VDENPGRADYATELAQTFLSIGSMLGNSRRFKDAQVWHDRAIAILAPLLKNEPEDAKVREALFHTHVGRAMNFEELKLYPEAVKDRARAFELAPPEAKTEYLMRLMNCRARAGQFEAALKDADELAKDDSKDAKNFVYDCACIYGLAHAKTKDDKQAARAVELLRQAVAKGFRDVAHMKQDTDLDSLRARDDFRKLVAELEKEKSP